MDKEGKKDRLVRELLKVIAEKAEEMSIQDVLGSMLTVSNHLQYGLVIGKEVFPQGKYKYKYVVITPSARS